MRKIELFFTVPEKDVAAFSQGVIETLDALGIDYECDETSPPDDAGETIYRVIGVVVPDADGD